MVRYLDFVDTFVMTASPDGHDNTSWRAEVKELRKLLGDRKKAYIEFDLTGPRRFKLNAEALKEVLPEWDMHIDTWMMYIDATRRVA